jgi:hypothetical protein
MAAGFASAVASVSQKILFVLFEGGKLSVFDLAHPTQSTTQQQQQQQQQQQLKTRVDLSSEQQNLARHLSDIKVSPHSSIGYTSDKWNCLCIVPALPEIISATQQHVPAATTEDIRINSGWTPESDRGNQGAQGGGGGAIVSERRRGQSLRGIPQPSHPLEEEVYAI